MNCSSELLVDHIGELVSRFMVSIPPGATNRRVDVINEGLDLALRARFPPLEGSDLVMLLLLESPQRLVAPSF